jgi:hypothetical protein
MVQLIHDVTILMSSVLLSSIANRASGFITSTSIPPFKKRSDQKILVLKAERFIPLLLNGTAVTQKTPHRIAYHVSNLSEKEQVWVFSADSLRSNTSSQECTSLKRRDATYHVRDLFNMAEKIPTSHAPASRMRRILVQPDVVSFPFVAFPQYSGYSGDPYADIV